MEFSRNIDILKQSKTIEGAHDAILDQFADKESNRPYGLLEQHSGLLKQS